MTPTGSPDRPDRSGSGGRAAGPLPGGARALVVDDEPALVRAVAGYLEREGFAVDTAADGRSALRAARADVPDVVVLDLTLPDVDGVEVCRVLRTFTDAYVIMLTARADEVDKLIGLSVGADDYLTKPFSPRELVARVRTMLRRPRVTAAVPVPDPDGVLRFGELSIDPLSREVRVGGSVVELTRTEFDVLAVLAARPRQAFTRRRLTDAVWGADWVGDEHLVDVHVGHVRRKLGDDAADPRYILTVRGIGYRMGPG